MLAVEAGIRFSRLQSLLAERFKLAAHTEKKEVPRVLAAAGQQGWAARPEASQIDCRLPAGRPTSCVHNEAHVIFPGDGRLTYDCICKRSFAAYPEVGWPLALRFSSFMT